MSQELRAFAFWLLFSGPIDCRLRACISAKINAACQKLRPVTPPGEHDETQPWVLLFATDSLGNHR